MILIAGAAGTFAMAVIGAPPLALMAGAGVTIILAAVEWLVAPRPPSKS